MNLRDLLFWRPRCARCKQRKPEFVDGLCFECVWDRLNERTVNALLLAVYLALLGVEDPTGVRRSLRLAGFGK